MTRHFIEQVRLDAIQFERVKDNKRLECYVAYFVSQYEKNNRESLQSAFVQWVLNRFRAVFNAQLPRPKYVAADDKTPTAYLVFSLTQEQYKFYCQNTERFAATEERHKCYYSFFHRYELPKDNVIYVQRVPDRYVDTAIDIANYLRQIIKRNRGAFNKCFTDDRMSSVQNAAGRFVMAHFIKTAEDYNNWILFLKEVYSGTAKMRASIPEDLFAEQSGRQQEVDREFIDRRVPFYQFTNISERLNAVYDFKWNKKIARRELVVQGKTRQEFRQMKYEIRKVFLDTGIPCYIQAREEPEYYRYLQRSFKNCPSVSDRSFSFFIDFHRNKIVYHADVELDGAIVIFSEKGCYRCQVSEIFTADCSSKKKAECNIYFGSSVV